MLPNIPPDEVGDYTDALVNTTPEEVPFQLPMRFFLKPHHSRYAYTCSKDDINQAGFLGPYPLPELSETEKAVWNPATSSWDVAEKSPEDYIDPANESVRVVEFIENALARIPDITNTEEYDIAYRTEWGAYEHTLVQMLYNSKRGTLLTWGDLPAQPVINPQEFAERMEIVKAGIAANLERWREQYETYGFIRCVDPDLKDYFEVPSDWVPGNQPLPEDESSYLGPNAIVANAG